MDTQPLIAVSGSLAGIIIIHAAVLAAPQVKARLGEAMLSAQFFHWHAFICLFQEPDDLFLVESLLHVQPPRRG
jgi:uncharacterized membrane protein (DUF441 family)